MPKGSQGRNLHSTIGSVGFKTQETVESKRRLGGESKMSFAGQSDNSNTGRIFRKSNMKKLQLDTSDGFDPISQMSLRDLIEP